MENTESPLRVSLNRQQRRFNSNKVLSLHKICTPVPLTCQNKNISQRNLRASQEHNINSSRKVLRSCRLLGVLLTRRLVVLCHRSSHLFISRNIRVLLKMLTMTKTIYSVTSKRTRARAVKRSTTDEKRLYSRAN